MLPFRLGLPPYVAVIEPVPTAKAEVANVALWVEASTVRVPSVTVPFLNVTVPLTDPPDAGITVAVKVTDPPWVEGLRDDARAVVEAALFTVSFSAAEVLPASSPLPA